MTIKWITLLLGTAPYATIEDGKEDLEIVDVRDLVDKAGNDHEAILKKIKQGVNSLRKGKKTVVCCDYGMSRSNAIAAGILTLSENADFSMMLRKVQKAIGKSQIKLEPLLAVREALGLCQLKKRSEKQGKILITGANGFLGSALCRAIDDSYKVIAPSHSDLDLSHGNTNIGLLADDENVTCIIHLANPRIYTSNVAMGQTLTMLRNVIDVSISFDILLIYISSWEVYSGYAGTLYADEGTPKLPRGPYGETKYLAEMLIEHACRKNELRCALLRSSPVYGLGSDRPKFIFNFAMKAFDSKDIVTHRYHNGEPGLDLLHIDDLTVAIKMVLDSGFTGTLNLGTGMLTSTRQIAQMIKEKLGSKIGIKSVPIHTHVASIAMESRKAKQKLGWEPKVSFDSGLMDLLMGINAKRSSS